MDIAREDLEVFIMMMVLDPPCIGGWINTRCRIPSDGMDILGVGIKCRDNGQSIRHREEVQ